ncbi:MAG: DUF2062 domain-containing protein [Thermodesulfobacteriota bacterium]
MTVKRTLRYFWLKFRRLQGSPQKLAWGMFLGVFIGMTPTIPLHSILALTLAPLLRISPVTAYLGIWVSNPVTMVPLYVIAYEVGRRILFRGEHIRFPETLDLHNILDFVWRGGLALQVGGLIIALPAAIIAYFLTLWVVQRYERRRQAHKVASAQPFSQDHPTASRPEA